MQTELEKLSELKERLLIHNMKDEAKWDKYDYELNEKLKREIDKLEKQIKRMSKK